MKQKHISLLLGAGFSVPKGYPTAKCLNEELLSFENNSNICFSAEGRLLEDCAGCYEKFTFQNPYQRKFVLCKKLIKEYSNARDGKFDYEEFYDFLKSDGVNELRYRSLFDNENAYGETYEESLRALPEIYNQMVMSLLKDKEGKSDYNVSHVGPVDGYNGFLLALSELSRDYVVDVHTLNHDLLFESFNKNDIIGGKISDGFDEFGSEYYGKLNFEECEYHCRLEKFTNRYCTPIRLYKLHGSRDYVRYYRSNGAFKVPDNCIKLKRLISPGDIMKTIKSKREYDDSFEINTFCMTGLVSKQNLYNEPLMVRKLFKRFRTNLHKAELLIVIGYGCKDEGINKIIKENYDYKAKQVIIIDVGKDDSVRNFANETNAKHFTTGVEHFDLEMLRQYLR